MKNCDDIKDEDNSPNVISVNKTYKNRINYTRVQFLIPIIPAYS